MKEEPLWFIKIEGKEEGPYSFDQLRRDFRLTPDTLIRRAHSKKFAPIKSFKELKELFKEEKKKEEEARKVEWPKDDILERDAQNPGPFIDFLVLILIVSLLWMIFWVFHK